MTDPAGPRRTGRILIVGALICVGLLGAGLSAAVSAPLERASADRPDDASVGAKQVHVVYALPSDGVDRGLDTSGVLAGSVESWLAWMQGQTGGPTLRVDRFMGAIDVTFVRLEKTEAQMRAFNQFIRDEIEKQMAARGLLAEGKIYAVFYDGAANAGTGEWGCGRPACRALIYLRGTFEDPGVPPCASNSLAGATDPPGYLEFATLHEMMHVLGIVPTCAPHHTRAGHT